jgi:wyosine [tRNA(Phe)-imidazoG37] synthetase (radical SAM superfamily)
VIDLIGRVMATFALAGKIKLVLITNGSLIDRPRVQEGLKKMAALNGETWFKLDSATATGLRRINQTRTLPEKHFERLKVAASLCPTWIQTCAFALDGAPPSQSEQDAYLAIIRRIKQERVPIQGVLLYGLARPSLQPDAPRLAKLPAGWMENWAEAIRNAGLPVKLTP